MIIEGYAALFGVSDLMRDVVRAGAFRDSLLRRADALPMYVEHEMRALAGHWSEAFEDARGLFVRGDVKADLPGAARAQRLMARGGDGLSIGFVTIAAHQSRSGRMLEEVDLLEVSLVTQPMQPLARFAPVRGLVRAI